MTSLHLVSIAGIGDRGSPVLDARSPIPDPDSVTLRTADVNEAAAIHDLIVEHLMEGHLLPRELGEIAVHAHRFVVAMQGRQRDTGMPRTLERTHDRVLPALPEMTAGMAIGDDFLGQPRVRDDREPQADEVPGRVRERAEFVEAGHRRAVKELVEQAASDAKTPRAAADDQRTDLRDRAAQGRQLRAREDLVALHGDDEAVRVHGDLIKLAREEVPLRQMLDDQIVNGRCFVHVGGAQRDRVRIRDRGSGIKNR